MLTAIRVSAKQKKLSITLPKLDHFLHRVFTECARAFWKAPFLFAEHPSAVEKQKNILQAESMCIDAVSGAVRSLLPVKNILRDYLDESDSDEDAAVTVSKSKDKKSKAESESDSESEEETAPTAAAAAAAAPVAPGPFSAKPIDTPIESEVLDAEPAPKASTAPPVNLEKLDTPPGPPKPTTSNHEVKEADVKAPVKIEKLDSSPVSADPPKLLIDTEPAVHFTPYDTVFDENTPGVSEIRYAEKVSVEDKPPSNWGLFEDDEEEEDAPPRLSFSGDGSSLGLDDVEDLDAPAAPAAPSVPVVSAVTPEEDFDAPLGSTADFEELA